MIKNCIHIYGTGEDMDWNWFIYDPNKLDHPNTQKVFTFCPDCGIKLNESENNGKKL